jgi:hypothetical protein
MGETKLGVQAALSIGYDTQALGLMAVAVALAGVNVALINDLGVLWWLPLAGLAASLAVSIATYPLEGELGFIKAGGSPSVGVDLRPTGFTAPALVKYECGGGGTGSGAQVSEVGSVIAPTKIDAMSTESVLNFKSSKAHQIPEKLEGEPKDVLTTIVHNKSVTLEQSSGWTLTAKSLFEEPLEIKALV